MLVLSRRIDQTIIVTTPSGEVIEFMIVGVERDRVKVGTTAPNCIILRGEIKKGEPLVRLPFFYYSRRATVIPNGNQLKNNPAAINPTENTNK